jgi:hypothetical protein
MLGGIGFMKDSNSRSTRRRKLLFWAAGLLLAYTLIGFLILPPIVRRVAVKQLSAQLGREVSIKAVKFNPFVLSATVDGLLIKDKDGQPFVSWDEVYVNFQLASFFGHAWVFKEISTSRPFVRVEMNKDGTFNFTDIITKFSTNAAPATAKAKTASAPLALHVEHLHIGGAAAAYADFSPRTPFKRVLGPLDITLDDFRTDPDNKNPYAFTGTTDAGEKISWSGFFYLSPLRSEGELKLFHFALTKYAPLYQDFTKFEIRDGVIALDVKYKFALDGTNLTASVSNSAFGLRDFKVGTPGDTNNLAELPVFTVMGLGADLQNHTATVGAINGDGAKLYLSRDENAAINVVELSKPAVPNAAAGDGILLLLRSVTNAVAMLMNSTNQWRGAVNSVDITNCAVHLEDRVNSRPASLDLTEMAFTAKNISNLPGTNLTAELALRWNTNGSIKTTVSASFLPPTADVQIDVDKLDLGRLDPYLEPKVNLFILGSEVGLHGQINLTTPDNTLPQVTFHGDARLDNFRTVDGTMGEDLLKWASLQFNGIDANLSPQSVAIKEIYVDSLYARLVIETNKTINLLNALRLTNTNAPATNVTKVAAAPPAATTTNAPLPQFSIGAIVITNTAFSFSDRSMQPNVNLAIEDLSGSIAGISSEQLQHADVDLHAKVDGVGPVAITGRLNPFSGTQTNRIKIAVHDVDLTPASPYAGKFAGYQIAEGKLNLDLTYELVGKKLDSKNVITLDQFNFGDKVNSPDATHLPVRLAIALLKDREGKIVLDVPVQGSLDDPKFRISKVVWGVIENILVKVATSPFSLLGALFGGGGEELGQQDFALGSAELTAVDKARLDSLLKGLYARPALNLEIAGSVDPDGDREGWQRAALNKEIRTRLWAKFRQEEQATNSVDAIVLTPEARAKWVERLYTEAVADGKITPQLIAANSNLVAYAAQALPHEIVSEKGATKLMNSGQASGSPAAAEATAKSGNAYQTKLVPPPEPDEAVLLATIPVSDADLETLAASRAKAVQDYLLASGKVTAARLFLKQGELRRDGSKVFLSFR